MEQVLELEWVFHLNLYKKNNIRSFFEKNECKIYLYIINKYIMNENTLFREQPITTIIELLPHTQSKDLEHYMLEELKKTLINKYDPDYGIINKIKNIIR